MTEARIGKLLSADLAVLIGETLSLLRRKPKLYDIAATAALRAVMVSMTAALGSVRVAEIAAGIAADIA